jgi:serine protease
MRNHLRRYAVGALAIGAVAGGTAVALPANITAATEWRPATYGLAETPEQLLPGTVSTEQPVRVVSTTLDKEGRPVVTVDTATNKTAAAHAVKKAQTAENAVGVELDAVVTATGVPTGSDTYRSQQWDFGKVRVAEAWPTSTGAGVTVAVIDTGVDARHPDLAGNVLSGYDAIANTAGTSTDPNGHGTHVAGTIAALTGNGAGVSAVAPEAKILPITVLGANGSGYMSDTAEGIIWATDHGATVINMSLGSSSKVTAVSNAIAYARSKGVVVVAAAGNERAQGSPTSYPAADAGVIGVAATDSADKVASYSNQGSYVDVAAPGSGIISTYPTALGMSYASMNGTSMASPHVAAVAALIRAHRPALTPDQVQAAMEGSAVDLGTAGKDIDYGHGRIDAVAALSAAGGGTASPSPSVSSSANPSPSASKTTSPSPSASKTASPTPSATKTASPTPTKPVVKVRPFVTVTASPAAVVYGTTTTVTYKVTAAGAAWAQKPVRIGVRTATGPAFAYTDATTDTSGKVVFTQPATARFQVKLIVPATDTTYESVSPVTTFTVRAAVAVSSPAAGKLKAFLTGTTGQKVQVQRNDRGRWLVVTSFTAEQAETTLTGLASGGYRIVVASSAAVTGATSNSVNIA